MLSLRNLILTIVLSWVFSSGAGAVDKKSKVFDERYFKIDINYSDTHGEGYTITGTLNRIDENKRRFYEGLLVDSRYQDGNPRKVAPDGMLALALQLQHYEKIFEQSFSIGNFYATCTGVAEVKIQIGGKNKTFKMCPNDPAPNKNFLKVMNWLVYMKKISHDQFVGPLAP